MENNELNNGAESLFATKRKKQQEAEAEKKRLEELEQQKRQMEAEVRRLEAVKAAQEAQQQQQQTFGPAPGMKPAGVKKGLNPRIKKTMLYILAVLGVVIGLLFIIGWISDIMYESKGGSEPTPEPENRQVETEPSKDGYEEDPNMLYFNGHQYLLVEEDLPWMDARMRCMELGGHLVTITSPEEQDFLMRNFYDQKLWLGAYRDEWDDWCWVTGEEWFYEYWADGEPNNSDGEEWCACFWTDMHWNDIREGDPGGRVSGFLCEFDDWADASAYDSGSG